MPRGSLVIRVTNNKDMRPIKPNPSKMVVLPASYYSASFSLSFPKPAIKFSPRPKLSSPKAVIGYQSISLSSVHLRRLRVPPLSSTMASRNTLQEVLPPSLDSTSDPPPIFDGTTRLYISYTCPYAQRVWITRNCKGLQDRIKLIPIDLQNRPAWYKEKVYEPNKVPALEHNNEVKGESLDLIKYIDSHFEGPSLFTDDPVKRDFAEELLSCTDSFRKDVYSSIKGNVNEAGAAFDYIEKSLSKFDDGPFFLGQFSLVDIAYIPFIERFKPFLLDLKNYDITHGRPKLAAWIEAMNKIEGYKQTRRDPRELVESLKKRLMAHL